MNHETEPLRDGISAQGSDELGWEQFCDIFVDTQLPIDALEWMIAGQLNAPVVRNDFARVVVGPGYQLDMRRNERRLTPTDRQPSQPYDFVDWPYRLEVDVTTEQTRQTQITVIARLLLGLWEARLGSVVVCAFEEALPQRGGYHPALPRTEL